MSKDKEVLESLKKRIAAKRPKSPVERMKVFANDVVKVQAAELKAAVEANPSHPVAEGFATGLRLGADDEITSGVLAVNKVQLQGLLEDVPVETEETVEDGTTYVKHVLKKGPVVASPPKPKKETKTETED